MHESRTFNCVFSLEHCWAIICHLCPFWNQLFRQPSHLQPRTAFLFMSVWHLMSNSYSLVCHLLPNNPPGLMLCNPVRVSNNSLMLPGERKSADQTGMGSVSAVVHINWCQVSRCWRVLVHVSCFGTMHELPSVSMQSGRETGPNVFLLMAPTMTILLEPLISCLWAVTTAWNPAQSRSVLIKILNKIILLLIRTVMWCCNIKLQNATEIPFFLQLAV